MSKPEWWDKIKKPAYQVPTMIEIGQRPRNAYKLVSTFSGCGGSCLGFKMEGFSVLWANEFIPSARETYAANNPDTMLDDRDIRDVQVEEILHQIGMQPGDLDVFEGSPPCASFSTCGKGAVGWGAVRKYSDVEQRTDDLFFQYARLLRGLRPKVFVAENVSGLVKGVAKGYFLMILRTLKECGYRVEARLLDAQWLGVPQSRQRLIFVGTRVDLPVQPAHPRPLPYRYSLREAIGLARGTIIHDTGGQWGLGDVTDRPGPTVRASGSGELFVEHVEPEADISRYAIGDEWDKLHPGEQSSKYFQLVKPEPDEPCPTITAAGGTASIASITHPLEKRKFTIAELRRACGFPDDFILKGSYAQQWERLGRAVPPVMMAAVARVIREEILDKLEAK